jgi:hypothetical protein
MWSSLRNQGFNAPRDVETVSAAIDAPRNPPAGWIGVGFTSVSELDGLAPPFLRTAIMAAATAARCPAVRRLRSSSMPVTPAPELFRVEALVALPSVAALDLFQKSGEIGFTGRYPAPQFGCRLRQRGFIGSIQAAAGKTPEVKSRHR